MGDFFFRPHDVQYLGERERTEAEDLWLQNVDKFLSTNMQLQQKPKGFFKKLGEFLSQK